LILNLSTSVLDLTQPGTRLLRYLLTGQYLAERRSEHAAGSETGVRAGGRTWGCSLLDFATALQPGRHTLDKLAGGEYNAGTPLAFAEGTSSLERKKAMKTDRWFVGLLCVGFSQNPVIPPGDSVLTVGNTGAATAGSYDTVVTGLAPTATVSTTVRLNLFGAPPEQPSLIAPPDGATGVSVTPFFSWTAVTRRRAYLLEVVTDAGFSNVVYSARLHRGNDVGCRHGSLLAGAAQQRLWNRKLLRHLPFPHGGAGTSLHLLA
jgi:hypothetical protein